MQQTKFTAQNLPKGLLEPPIPAPHQHTRRYWRRNWTIFYLCQNWDPQLTHGRYPAIAAWLAQVEGGNELSRQRIEKIYSQVLWHLRDRLTLSHETIEEHIPAA